MENRETPDAPDRIQLHRPLPYKFEARDDPQIRSWLDRGYRIVHLQRVTDHEVLVTLVAAEVSGAS